MNAVFIPVLMNMLLGNTIDLRTYDLTSARVSDPDNDEKVLVNETIIAYKVLDDTFPFDFFDIPVDLALRIKRRGIYWMSIPTMEDLIRHPDWKKKSVIVAFTTIHRTIDRKLKGNISLTRVDDQKLPTHYVEALLYGGRATAVIEFRCSDIGDVELVRDRVKSVLGESGTLTDEAKTLELWKNVLEAVDNIEGMRGSVHANSRLTSTGAIQMPNHLFGTWNYIQPLFNYSQWFKTNFWMKDVGLAMIMKLKPLHDLDPSYPVAEKNSDIEKIMKEMYEMLDDMGIATSCLIKLLFNVDIDLTDEEEEKIDNLIDNIQIVERAMYAALDKPSIYSEMNMTAILIAGRLYERYLPSNYSASSYYMSYLKLREDLNGNRCENEFWPGKEGLLEVESGENKILSHDPESLDECKEECLNERRCRAFAYTDQLLNSTQGIRCWIYYRSSITASIISTNNELNENMRIYDRKCM